MLHDDIAAFKQLTGREGLQVWTRHDRNAGSFPTIPQGSGPPWELVVGRITRNARTGQVLACEQVEGLTEKELCRRMGRKLHISTSFLHTPSGLPIAAKVGKGQGTNTEVDNALAVSVTPLDKQTDASFDGVVSFSLSASTKKRMTTAAKELDDAGAHAFVTAVRYGRDDLAEICCTSNSQLAGSVIAAGGRASRYSGWNGYDLITKKARTR